MATVVFVSPFGGYYPPVLSTDGLVGSETGAGHEPLATFEAAQSRWSAIMSMLAAEMNPAALDRQSPTAEALTLLSRANEVLRIAAARKARP